MTLLLLLFPLIILLLCTFITVFSIIKHCRMHILLIQEQVFSLHSDEFVYESHWLFQVVVSTGCRCSFYWFFSICVFCIRRR
eukprot:UN03255